MVVSFFLIIQILAGANHISYLLYRKEVRERMKRLKEKK